MGQRQRLVVELSRGIGSLTSTSWVSSIIAVNADGSHERMMYNREPAVGSNFPGMWPPYGLGGAPALAGTPHPANGHFFIILDHAPHSSLGDAWQHGSTDRFDVDATTGHTVEIGRIAHANMTLMAWGDVARIAAGHDGHMRAVAFYSTDGTHWTSMPAATVGEMFEPWG